MMMMMTMTMMIMIMIMIIIGALRAPALQLPANLEK